MNQQTNFFRLILLCSVFLLCKPAISKAQGFSYVYIQGDKKTPIYVKVEGVMMPRYGKNYALLSRLAPGPLNIDILFQQNEHPTLTFSILVPENGKRAFVLNNKNGEFSLYDVEQNFYLKPNNDISDDHVPTILNTAPVVAEISTENETNEVPKAVLKESTQEVGATESVQNKETQTADIKNPKQEFITDITFDNDGSKKEAITTASAAESDNAGTKENETQKITNSDCSGNISMANFQKLLNTTHAKRSEDERLGLIQNAIKQYCFSTLQAKKLIEKLETDLAKLSALKKIYPKITDQNNFSSLEELITDEDWKNYFRGMLNK